MNSIEEKIMSLVGNCINYQGQKLRVKSGKETTRLVVLQTDKFPINFNKHSLEFKNLTPMEEESEEKVNNKIFNKIESKMNTPQTTQSVENNQAATQLKTHTFHDERMTNALQGSKELKETLLDTLNRLKQANTNEERKNAGELAKSVAQVAKELNDLFKTGVRAVEVLNKI